jgi:hypothetical protein
VACGSSDGAKSCRFSPFVAPEALGLEAVGAGLGAAGAKVRLSPGKVVAAPLPTDASQQLEVDGSPQLGAAQQSSTGTR